MSKKYMVKYCETVNHFYYKYVDAKNSDEADEIANQDYTDWTEDHHSNMEERQCVEIWNATDEITEFEL
jgi:hypothetical protein|tara:strand:+ start:328 stop:534 length:207 start_codon:yes stop_codon:yes gene_type:complete